MVIRVHGSVKFLTFEAFLLEKVNKYKNVFGQFPDASPPLQRCAL
jgi:hypothetical protein